MRVTVQTMIASEALALVHDWERRYGHSAEDMSHAVYHGTELGAELGQETRREGAGLWLDYEKALRGEGRTRAIAAAERAELLSEEIAQAASSDIL